MNNNNIGAHFYLMARTDRPIGYPTTEWAMYRTWCARPPSWYYLTKFLNFFGYSAVAVGCYWTTVKWWMWFDLPPPLANIGGNGNIEPVGCIKLVDDIAVIFASCECGQIVSAQLDNCHWLPELGPPPLPQ